MGLFQQEPAITEFDWLFTPNLQSHKRMPTGLLRASTRQNLASPCCWLDHPVSGNTHVTLALSYQTSHKLQVSRFPFESVMNMTYPRHISKLLGTLFRTHDTTPKSSIFPYPLDFRCFKLSITSSLQRSLTVLLYAIGLKKCLRLEVDDSRLRASIPRGPTHDICKIFLSSPTGLSPSTAFLSRKLWIESEDRKTDRTTPHLRSISREDSVCLVLSSLAATDSISIDFSSFGYCNALLPRV